MAELWGQIRSAIASQRYAVGLHAAIRLRQRRIPIWQAVSASLEGKLVRERRHAEPNAVVEVVILLPDGTAAKAVWAWIAQDASAKLVTVHLMDR